MSDDTPPLLYEGMVKLEGSKKLAHLRLTPSHITITHDTVIKDGQGSPTDKSGKLSSPVCYEYKLCEVIAVRASKSDASCSVSSINKLTSMTGDGGGGTGGALEMEAVSLWAHNTTLFSLHVLRRAKRFKWKVCSLLFNCHVQSEEAGGRELAIKACNQWIEKISAKLNEFHERPKKLLVFINPYGGRKRAPKIYSHKVAPLFALAGIETDVITTEYAGHARQYVLEAQLDGYNGVVSVGGDGMFNEVLNGLIHRTQKEHQIDVDNVRSKLKPASLRIGIIPAGSTDAVVYGTTGINDPVTSALHIILGDSLPLDATAIHDASGGHLLHYVTSLLGYGFCADVLTASEQYRWMGPHRYNYCGAKKFVKSSSYSGVISYLPSGYLDESHPTDNVKCVERCSWCAKMTVTRDGGDGRPEEVMSCEESVVIEKTGVLPDVSGEKEARGDAGESGDGVVGAVAGGNREPSGWSVLTGRFLAINSATISCICKLAANGLSPNCHVGDGCTDLIVVEDTSRTDYLKYLMRTFTGKGNHLNLPFVKVLRVHEFRFKPTSENKSCWNSDGEILEQPEIHVKVHCQLIKLFARGIEDRSSDDEDSPNRCSCAPCC